ncbi:hypothetical protein BH11ARM1_BH11ARM1_08680 [soil metagenome]
MEIRGIQIFEPNSVLPALPSRMSKENPDPSGFGYILAPTDSGEFKWMPAGEDLYRMCEALRLDIRPSEVTIYANCQQTEPRTCVGGCSNALRCMLLYFAPAGYYYCNCV